MGPDVKAVAVVIAGGSILEGFTPRVEKRIGLGKVPTSRIVTRLGGIPWLADEGRFLDEAVPSPANLVADTHAVTICHADTADNCPHNPNEALVGTAQKNIG